MFANIHLPYNTITGTTSQGEDGEGGKILSPTLDVSFSTLVVKLSESRGSTHREESKCGFFSSHILVNNILISIDICRYICKLQKDKRR